MKLARIIWLTLACTCTLAWSAEWSPVDLKLGWPVQEPHAFHQALRAGAGFSFSFAGTQVGPTVDKEWRVSTENQAGVQRTIFRHSTGLTVVREATPLPEFEAIEYTLRFKNESSASLTALGPIQAMNLIFGGETVPGVSVISSGGGMAESSYPPAQFAIERRYPRPEVILTTAGGRSSNKDLPFFFVANEKLGQGLFLAMGWSGQWTVAVRTSNNQLQVVGGIPNLEIRLQPGEEISGPQILVGCYRGTVAEGSNRLRRLIRSHCTPSLDSKPYMPVAAFDHYAGVGPQFTEALLRKQADAAAAIGQEYFLLDAGWYAGVKGRDFSSGVGNWEEADRTKFPQGMGPFADYLRSKGLHFGLWFEPERVARESQLARQHPDWVIWLPPGVTQDRDFCNPKYGLLDFGQPEVQAWVQRVMDRYISELNIRYIRYDFNIDPLAYWDGKDPEGRRGISQIRHIEGFYKVIDWIRERHPKTILEGCAAGGRRIDLQTARRFHTFWISDESEDSDIVRWHLHGLNYFLPGNYLYACYGLPKPDDQPESSFQAYLGGAFGMEGRIDEWSPAAKQRAARHVAVYKELRKFLTEDYYPLTPQSRDLKSWEAWQFHDPKTSEGFVQAFRLESQEPSTVFRLRALEPNATYLFSDVYSGKTIEVPARSAMEHGIAFQLEPGSSEVLRYRKVERPIEK